jgi:hypothetical protein
MVKPGRVGKAQRAHADTVPVAACGPSKPRQNRVGTALWQLPTSTLAQCYPACERIEFILIRGAP